MIQDTITDEALRAVVVRTLQVNPTASFGEIQDRLRVRSGRVLDPVEIQRLQQIFHDEGYEAGAVGLASSNAKDLATSESLSHARPTVKELGGLASGIVPFFIHFQSAAPAKIGGAAATYFDLVALSGGIIALIFGLGAASMVKRTPQQPFHIALTAAVVLLGAYQVLLGLGLLHRMGIFRLG